MLLQLILGFLSIMVPGTFLALALLKKTKMPLFEIVVIGFIFGLIFPPGFTWGEAYLIPYIHAFSYSEGLYNANVILLTVIGIILSFQQGVFDLSAFKKKSRLEVSKEEIKETGSIKSEYNAEIVQLRKNIAELGIDLSLIQKHRRIEEELIKKNEREMQIITNPEEREKVASIHAKMETELIKQHEIEERKLLEYVENKAKPKAPKNMTLVWGLLFAFMMFAFFTRIANIGAAPTFFEFDPYFDMQSTQYILVYGHQLLYDHSAWPTLINGNIHRIEPLVPYIEAYWYNLAGGDTSTISTNMLSDVSSFYPPITAALLVFSVFFILYEDYGSIPALFAAGLTAGMPALITAFIAGEQLLEPWGIFTLFFFIAAYLLAVKNPKEKRYAVLAAIAFISSFLGAHYYTVTAGILTAYIGLQGIIHILRKEDMKDFYTMNAIVVGIIAIAYIIYAPYGGALADRIPTLLGIPVIVAFPLSALVFVVILDYIPQLLVRYKIFKKTTITESIEILIAMIVILLLLIEFTPLGAPVKGYIALSEHFTTPSIPLFMTVQEYAPTGMNFNFGSAGFGFIGASIGGVNIIVWAVLVVFGILAVLSIYYRRSKSSILYFATIIPLTIAGMVEVKYLPHFGIAYILALALILGEIILYIKNDYKFPKSGNLEKVEEKSDHKKAILVMEVIAAFIVVIFVGLAAYSVISGFANANNCNAIANNQNSIGYDMFCNTVPGYWLDATAWMRANVGPSGPRILSWWDYGDWINWFGNSNAVLRGDNAVATSDYKTAAQYVLGPSDGFSPRTLGNFMDSSQAKYVLFDNQIMQKWQALDFLACIDVNETSKAFATQAGVSQGQPYALGTSQCEINHDPAFMLVPESVSSLSTECQIGNQTGIQGMMVYGNSFVNQTFCIPTSIYTELQGTSLNSTKPIPIYNANGTKTDAVLIVNSQFFYGQVALQGQNFLYMMVLYKPNGPNNTVIGAPTAFYNSNYYRGFMFGNMPGYTLAFPNNFTGINYINTTAPIMIYQLNNYTGGLPYHTPKPAWVNNTYETPG
jgi:asparagine N-glycosylation enzyme membrane subunit Stt3